MKKSQRHEILVASASYRFSSAPRLENSNVRLRIKLEGESYDVDVEVLPQRVDLDVAAPMPDNVGHPPPPPDAREEDKICRSPIAGIVVSVSAQPGQRVRQDDPVLVIEAMKMLTTIGAPLDGTVQEIHVSPGQTVKPGQPLCTLV
jgi:methylmalonyl-CoA carboxyltransferase small subunit